MAIERRPSRPPTGPLPAPKPTTRVPRKSPTTRFPQRPATRVIRPEGGATTRSAPVTRKKSNTPLIVGGAAGGALLLIIIIAVAASGSKQPSGASNSKKSAPKAVNVADLEREGEAKCEEGYGVIQRCEGMMTGRALSGVESAKLKADLERGIGLIQQGLSRFEQAMDKSGNKYDTTRFVKAFKAAKMKLGELGTK